MTANESRLTELCATATRIVNDGQVQLVFSLECVLGLAAIWPNVALLSVLRRIRVLPWNLRILLTNLSLLLIWSSLGSTAKCLYLMTASAHLLVMTGNNCHLLELLLVNLCMPGTFFTLVTLCVERSYATVLYRRYDKAGGWLAFGLLAGVYAGACAANVHMMITASNNNEYLPFCDTYVFSGNHSAPPYFMAVAALEMLAMLIGTGVWLYGRHAHQRVMVNRAQYDLSARFLIDQNAQVNRLMMPSMILHFCFQMPIYLYILLIVPRLPVEADLPQKTALMHVNYLLRLSYALAHPLLTLFGNSSFRQHLGKDFTTRCLFKPQQPRVVAQDVVTDKEAHFNYLNKIWSQSKLGVKHTPASAVAAARGKSSIGNRIQQLTIVPSIPQRPMSKTHNNAW